MYNVERYIGECLESIFNQTFQDFEVIVVDDCSTDSSPAIVESCKEKFDGRLKLFHMDKNSGTPGAPRNKGLALSRGEYIFFMDSDDKFAFANVLENMYAMAKFFNADLIHYNKHYNVSADGSKIQPVHNKAYNPTDKIMIDENLPMRIQGILKNKFWYAPWRYFIKRDLIIENELFFPNQKTAEDTILGRALVLYAKKLLIVPHAVYMYKTSENSATRTIRTPFQWAVIIIESLTIGLNWLENALNKLPFFQAKPEYCHAILNQFALLRISRLSVICKGFSFTDMYNVMQTASAKIQNLNEWRIFLAALNTAFNEQQKINADNVQKFNQFAAQAQSQFKRFDQFAHQAQARIAQLETHLKNSQQRVAELETQLKTK